MSIMTEIKERNGKALAINEQEKSVSFQNDLQSPCNSYMNINAILHRTQKKYY